MEEKNRQLVIGADGHVGAALVSYLSSRGEEVLETTRRGDSAGKKRLFLELGRNASTWTPPLGVSVAYLCASVTSLAECDKQPAETAKINVEETVAVARKLAANGTFVVFPSTNLVFDGTVPLRNAADPTCPTTEYGRQKAKTEAELLALGAGVAVVRFSKIIEPDFPLFRQWATALDLGSEIAPFTDKFISPVPLDFSVEVLVEVGRRRLSGIMQVSGNRDITYEQAARRIARKLGKRQYLVKAVPAPRPSGHAANSPGYTTLDTTRLRQELGRLSPDAWEVVLASVRAT